MRARWVLGVLLLVGADALATPLAPYLVRPASWLVERLSGLPLKREVPVTPFTPEEARAYLAAELEHDVEGQDLDAQSQLLFSFGFLPRPVDLKAVSLNLISSQAAAFYDPRTGRFHNISRLGAADVLGEPVVVAHELTHAAQDQAVGASALFEARKNDDDRLRALQWVLEGEATVVGNRAGNMLGPPFPGPPGKLVGELTTWVSWTPFYARLALAGTLMTTNGEPPAPFLITQLLAPYLDGSRAFWTVEAALGKRAHAFMVCHPARSTEELMHPAKYLEGKDPPWAVSLPPPPAGTVRAELTQGEWALQWLLRQSLAEDVADRAAAGWGGDRMAVSSDGDVVWRILMDSPQDAQELHPALAQALPSLRVVRVHDEVHAFNAPAQPWALSLAAAPRTRHAPDPLPPPGSLCDGR